ncbi:hypothetical protein NY78_4402 [Desulfovibrio sp. TomC]|nr:hypothetical protein NY78_4402 [Desulfovibrio sp. TomC]
MLQLVFLLLFSFFYSFDNYTTNIIFVNKDIYIMSLFQRFNHAQHKIWIFVIELFRCDHSKITIFKFPH